MIPTCNECGATDNLTKFTVWMGGIGDILIYICFECLERKRTVSREAKKALNAQWQRTIGGESC